ELANDLFVNRHRRFALQVDHYGLDANADAGKMQRSARKRGREDKKLKNMWTSVYQATINKENWRGRSMALNARSNGLLPRWWGHYEICHVDAFQWLQDAKANSIHAVVTDPPYGLLEYSPTELQKLKKGRGGVWRIPPAFDGCKRSPLPRFTVLNG